ncbi:hypothetical protein A0O28_0088470 [Trichoderma guizhouense]|uniref:NmrA-like domain-containing protein n=1 Tax=Trichoderma guizhouense TaxID=1491466 RepID=A0A1T3CUE4_9HYPO|nr:hypothetical protein A0O28_0088470 [Trichoderma guizhouense]
MVKVAIAGGSGQVAREVIDALLESKKHDITILSRNAKTFTSTLEWQIVDYNDVKSLTRALNGVHTLLSFIQTLGDFEQKVQKNLIDAAIEAGVKRFSPSEYGRHGGYVLLRAKRDNPGILREINKSEIVLEYSLFQPGLFLDYLAYPYKTSKYVDPLQTIFDFQNKRGIVVEGHEDAIINFTAVKDFAAIVARAVDYEGGRWPIIGGIRGNRLTFAQVLAIGESVRGHPFAIEKVKIEDLEAGELKTAWNIEATHHAASKDDSMDMHKAISVGVLLSSTKGAWDSSDEINQLFPDFEFTKATEFLAVVWEGN